jgi:colanic acid/amylovoran biosynthesis glycosyltransferase
MSPLRVAYLVNQYPKVSHSFIRREIAALEDLGIQVARFSIRPCRETLPDPADRAEQGRTLALLDRPWFLFTALARTLLSSPLRFLRGLRATMRMGWHSDRGLIPHLAYLLEACRLLGHLRDGHVQHLHAHFATNPAAVAMLCRILGGPPYSFTAHGPDDFDRAPTLSLGEKIAGAKFVTSVSAYGRSQLLRWSEGLDWGKIHVVPMGLDSAFLEAETAPIPDTRMLVSIGRLHEQKGQLLLLEAIALLAAQDCPCQLLLIGEGPLRPALEAAVARLKLQGSVRLAGALAAEAIRGHLLAARVFVLPSFAENLPIVLMEALALERPVIATQIAGIPELVEHGACGWLVAPGDVHALAAAIRDALHTPAPRLAEMGSEGARRVHRNHDARGCAARLAEYFRGGNGA